MLWPFLNCFGKPLRSIQITVLLLPISQTYIQENYTDTDFYLGAVADYFNLSLNNLSQQFKRHLGMSPAKYITILRIDKAKELLTKTNKSVKDIALEIGYSDSSVFVRNFKNATSFTPVQYREMVRIPC